MQTLASKKEAYYLAVDNTDYPQNMKKYIKSLISNCATPEEIFQLTLFYLYNCQTAQLRLSVKQKGITGKYCPAELVSASGLQYFSAIPFLFLYQVIN